MIQRSDLKVGSTYFFVTYEDRELKIPVIETLAFRSETTTTKSDEASLLVFDRFGDCEPKTCRLTEDLLTTVFDFDGLVEELAANQKAQKAGKPYEPFT